MKREIEVMNISYMKLFEKKENQDEFGMNSRIGFQVLL